MGSSVFPAPSAASKTRYVVTLLSGTSWTVPAGVTYVNALLVGGGGGGGGTNGQTANGGNSSGGGGQMIETTLTTTPSASIAYAIGAGGTGSNGSGTVGGTTTFTGATSAAGGAAAGNANGGTAGNMPAGLCSANGGASGTTGGNGGAGSIQIEYWAQEMTMRTFAVIEDNKVINIIVGVEDEVVAANPGKYVEYTDGWDYNNGIDGGVFFPEPEVNND